MIDTWCLAASALAGLSGLLGPIAAYVGLLCGAVFLGRLIGRLVVPAGRFIGRGLVLLLCWRLIQRATRLDVLLRGLDAEAGAGSWLR